VLERVFWRAITQNGRFASRFFDPVINPVIELNGFYSRLYQGDKFPVHGTEHLAGFPDALDLGFVFEAYHWLLMNI
jgi:hypothetical protein